MDAFAMASVENTTDFFKHHQQGLAVHRESNPASSSISIPSRLRGMRSVEPSFAGLRIAVENNIDLRGVWTGASS